MRSLHIVPLLLAVCSAVSSCKAGGKYKFDTVAFRDTGLPAAPGVAPGIRIDTNITPSGLYGGTVKSAKPYLLCLDYTDETFTFKEAIIDKLTVTYDDGKEDPGAKALKLPMPIAVSPYETVNSMAGGKIVNSKVNQISARIPGVVTRDKPCTVAIEGRFRFKDGSEIPFSILRKFKVDFDKSTKPWSEVMRDG